VQSNRVIAAGAVGERKLGSSIPVTLNDRFHIGSCTKAMTALLAVDLVHAGKIELSTRVGDVFPEWNLDAEKREIPLKLLLQNLSGLSNTPDDSLWAQAFEMNGPLPEQRRKFLRDFLRQPLAAPPGTKYIYSNMGFALAGAMLETKAGTAWEELIRKRLFRPLHLGTAGFGALDLSRQIDAPWGHQIRDGKLVPCDPSDNPPAIAPAAAVHLSVLDAARYLAFQVAAFNGEVKELAPFHDAMYRAPAGSDYALGWIVVQRPWAGGTALTHSGSNTMFFTVFWIAPARHFAFAVMTNAGDPKGGAFSEKTDRVAAALIKEFLR
jgi:CubicO group peptidase (beta-lactamase class C family)